MMIIAMIALVGTILVLVYRCMNMWNVEYLFYAGIQLQNKSKKKIQLTQIDLRDENNISNIQK